jgi:hypothetical protein
MASHFMQVLYSYQLVGKGSFLMVPIFDRNQKKIEVDYRNMWSMQGFLVALGL